MYMYMYMYTYTYMYMYLYLYVDIQTLKQKNTRIHQQFQLLAPVKTKPFLYQISTFRSSPFVFWGGEIRDEPIDISKVADPENMDIVDKPLWREHGVASWVDRRGTIDVALRNALRFSLFGWVVFIDIRGWGMCLWPEISLCWRPLICQSVQT